MTVRDVTELRPETRAVVEEYLVALESGLCAVRTELARDTLAETRAHFTDLLETTSTPAEARAVAAQLGEPDAYATALCAEIEGKAARPASGDPDTKTILGMPYEFRVPTPERVRKAWWNPSDPRVFVPRVFGIGWDLNFGAIAVRVHLIRPDDEDEPFASVPERWLRAAIAVPVVLVVGMIASWALAAPSLPAELPVHWGVSGQPDRYSSAGEALGFLLALGGLPTIWAVWVFMTRSDGSRAIVSAFAALLATLAAAIFGTTLLWAYAEAPGWLLIVTILGSVAVPFGMLVVLARVNRREEWKKDLMSGGNV